jgi:hypothetical protein
MRFASLFFNSCSLRMNQVPEQGDFLALEIPVSSRGQVFQVQWSQSRALELEHRMAHGLAHSPNLSVPALHKGNSEPGMPALFGHEMHLGRRGLPSGKPYASAQSVQCFGIRLALYLYLVCLAYLVRGMGKLLCQLAVIGQKQKSA